MTDLELAGKAIEQAKSLFASQRELLEENYRLKLENAELRVDNKYLKQKVEILMRPLR